MASVSSSLQPCRTDTQSNKLYLYLWHTYSPVMYSLYEIDVPNPLPPPPTKDAQDEQIINPNHLAPILQLKTGEYPGNMCCVSLGSKLYFMGGEYDIDYPCIGAGVKINYKNDFFPRDVYIFDPTKSSSLLDGTAMNSGKSWPWAFVADEKIYVLGSNFTTDIFDISWRKDLELKSLSLFEVYHPKDDNWTILPNPPIGNVETRWVGHAVERRKVFFIAWQRGKERLYCFDLDRGQWTKHITLPSHLRNVSGRIEVIEGTLYGCYHNMIAAIAPVAEEEDEGEEREQEMEEGEEEEWEELEEEDEINIQQQQEEDEMGARFRNYRLHVVSRELGMNAIFNVPQQLQSSSSLLYLGNRCFCYVMTGMPPHPKYGSDHAIEDDKVRVISTVIFQALGETYKEDAIRLFRAKFLYSAHYAVKTPFPNEGIIHGCFSLGWESQQPQIEAVAGLQGWHTQAMGKFQTQYQAERSPFDKRELGSNDSNTGLCSQRLAERWDDRQIETRMVNANPNCPLDGHNSPLDDGFSWRKYGQKDILGSKYPRGYYRCTHRLSYGCRATKQLQMMDDNPNIFEVTYRGRHTCHMSSTVLSTGPLPSSVADQISPDVTLPSMDSLGSGSLTTVGPLPSVAYQISSDVTQLSMDSLGRGSFMTVGSGSSGADLSTAQSGEEVEHPGADIADKMFYSDNSSSSSMDFLFQPPEDGK